MSIGQAGDHSANSTVVPASLFANPATDRTLASYGIFLLRVAIGVDWIAHAFLKTWCGMFAAHNDTKSYIVPCPESAMKRLMHCNKCAEISEAAGQPDV